MHSCILAGVILCISCFFYGLFNEFFDLFLRSLYASDSQVRIGFRCMFFYGFFDDLFGLFLRSFHNFALVFGAK